MRRVGIRIANGVLFTLCCFLVASVFNDISAGFLMIAPSMASPSAEIESRRVRSWEDRKPILERNLFGAQVVTLPAAPPPEFEEVLEETKLPLRLLGTVAAANPATSRATIEDTNTRKHQVVRVGDFLEGHDRVQVASIERRRVILINDDHREELRLEEDEAIAVSVPRRPRRQNRVERRVEVTPSPEQELAERLRDLAEDTEKGVSGVELLAQGRFKAEFSEDQSRIIGMQIHQIEPGGLYDKLGLKDGDVITSVNGISLETVEAGNEMLLEFSQAEELEIELLDSDQPIRATRDQLN